MPAKPRISHVFKLLPNQKPPVTVLARALGSPIRWAILAQLSNGQADMVLGLARKLGLPAVTISQHIGVLRRAGLVTVGIGHLYTIAPGFLADAARGHLEFGCCLLRLQDSSDAPAA